jgi:hypothetical protein
MILLRIKPLQCTKRLHSHIRRGGDEFEGFLYVLVADAHADSYRSGIHVAHIRISRQANSIVGLSSATTWMNCRMTSGTAINSSN